MGGGSSSSSSATSNQYINTYKTRSFSAMGIEGPALVGTGNQLVMTDQGSLEKARQIVDSSMGVVNRTTAGAFDVAGKVIDAEVLKTREDTTLMRHYIDQVKNTSNDVIEMTKDIVAGGYTMQAKANQTAEDVSRAALNFVSNFSQANSAGGLQDNTIKTVLLAVSGVIVVGTLALALNRKTRGGL